MARYFFDIHNGHFRPDTDGVECTDLAGARSQAVKSLPEIARWVLPESGENQAFTVLVRDEEGAVVYTATLTFAGLKLAGDLHVA